MSNAGQWCIWLIVLALPLTSCDYAGAIERSEETVNGSKGGTALTDLQRQALTAAGWGDRVGHGTGVWVSVAEQHVRLIQNWRVTWEAPCSTAANGIGAHRDSYKTPPGWHVIKEAIGDRAAWGQVFKHKKKTKKVWRPGDPDKDDLVLTRVLALDGLEPGVNKGGKVDSYARYIYIHGTNDEARIGRPASHGCIRLTNDDAIKAFDTMPVGTPVFIGN